VVYVSIPFLLLVVVFVFAFAFVFITYIFLTSCFLFAGEGTLRQIFLGDMPGETLVCDACGYRKDDPLSPKAQRAKAEHDKYTANKREHGAYEATHEDDWNRRCASKCKAYARKKKCDEKPARLKAAAQICDDCDPGINARGQSNCFVCHDEYRNFKHRDRGTHEVCEGHKLRCIVCKGASGKYSKKAAACPLCWDNISHSKRCCFPN